jgi:hypothetical protein
VHKINKGLLIKLLKYKRKFKIKLLMFYTFKIQFIMRNMFRMKNFNHNFTNNFLINNFTRSLLVKICQNFQIKKK